MTELDGELSQRKDRDIAIAECLRTRNFAGRPPWGRFHGQIAALFLTLLHYLATDERTECASHTLCSLHLILSWGFFGQQRRQSHLKERSPYGL